MNRIGRLAEVSDAVWLPHLAVLLMECECDLAPRSAPIEGPVIGLKAVTGTERENEPFPSLRGCQRVGSQNVVFIGDLAPGAVATRHYHPGDEAIYMLEGALRFAPDHEQPFELKADSVNKR